jgi:serine/threonine-protein kinase
MDEIASLRIRGFPMTDPGKTLAGRYLIESVLGQGGMGAVYLASMEALGGKKVAIKEMELRGVNDREFQSAVKQFQSEARFLAHLDHPNLVQVTDFFVEGDKHYLVMAYVTGQTLQQKLRARGKAFDWPQVLEWARPLCAVLTYLHSQNPPILFRDLKPSNVMVEESGRLRLIDFGIARTGQEGERTSTFLQGTGTSGFSPLEQYGGGQSTDHRSDIYSLGATLYQLLTGKVPPDAVSRVSQGAVVPPPSTVNPDLPKALDSVLLKALAQNKADRHQSVAEVAADLEVVAVRAGTESETEDLGPGMATVPSRPEAASIVPAGSPSPNITVELMPSRPTATPLQVAAGLGAAAVVTLLLGSLLMSREPAATAAAGSNSEISSPPPVATVSQGSGGSGEKPDLPSPVPSERVRPVADGDKVPGDRIRQVRQSVASRRPEPEPEPERPASRPVARRVITAVATPRETVPTAKPRETIPVATRPAELPPPEPAPLPEAALPPASPEVAQKAPPEDRRPRPAGPRPGGWRPGDPFPPPEGVDPRGRPPGDGPPTGPPGYESGRRRR